MKGSVPVNTTRDYLKTAVFFASSAITLTTFSVGFAGELHEGAKEKERKGYGREGKGGEG